MSRRYFPAFRLISFLCIGTSFSAYAGTAPTTSTAPVAFIYVSSNYKANTARVYGYAAAADGTLTATPDSPYPDNVFNMAVNGKYLLASGYGNDPSIYPNIYTFAIGPHGYLTLADTVNVRKFPDSTCVSVGPMVLDRTGADLYLAAYNSDCSDDNAYMSLDISKSTGKLTFLSETPSVAYDDAPGIFQPLTFIGNNELAYTVYGDIFDGNNNFEGFKRDSSGSLVSVSIRADLVSSSQGFYEPVTAAADPTNHLAVVVINSGSEWQLSSYTVDESNGNLTTTSTAENMPRISVAGISNKVDAVFSTSMSPSGKLLAVGGTTGLQIFHFNAADPPTVDTGALTTDGINQVFWDNNNHLYAISSSAGKLFAFTITPTSAEQAPGSPYSIPSPQSLIVQPLGAACSAPSSPGVQVCSAASGATVASPVQVQAAAMVTGTIADVQLWVDGVKEYSESGNTILGTSLSLAAGTHRFAAVATNTAGNKWEQAVNATVR